MCITGAGGASWWGLASARGLPGTSERPGRGRDFPPQVSEAWVGPATAWSPPQLCCWFVCVTMETESQARPHARELFPGCESPRPSGRPSPPARAAPPVLQLLT